MMSPMYIEDADGYWFDEDELAGGCAEQAREKKLKFLEKYSKVIGVTIPYDPRFID